MFLTLEGIEGSGKSTLLSALAAHFASQGQTACLTREPGGCPLGKTLRTLLLHTESRLCPAAELFLFLADRAQHVEEVIRPALEAGNLVLCDRFADSTIVYQGYGRGFEVEELFTLNNQAIGGLWPHLTLVLDIDPLEGLRRANARNNANGLAQQEGRFEAETLAFHTRIRQGFRTWAALNPARMVVLDASQSPGALLEQALSHVLACHLNSK